MSSANWKLAAAVAVALSFVAPASAAPSLREIVYFGPNGPIRIRLNITLAEQPVEAAWAKALDSLFALRDRNGDGGLDEIERAPLGPARTTPQRMFVDGPPVVQPLRLTFPQKEDKVTRAGLGEAMKSAGKDAIAFRVVSPPPESAALSAALFRHLDRNGDGRLSVEELKSARQRLAFLDTNEDEFVTAAELLGRGALAGPGRVRPFPAAQPPDEPRDPSTEVIFLTQVGELGVRQLLAARVGAKATALKKSEFGAEAKNFAGLDQDGNGILDSTELAAWLNQSPDVEITVAFAAAGNRVTAVRAKEANGGWTATLPGGIFRFDAASTWPASRWIEEADRITSKLRDLAKANGAVERKHAESEAISMAFFEIADHKGDRKVGAAEIESTRKALEPLAACRVDVECLDHGSGLFQLLDRDGDGRLSPREIVAAVAVLKPLAAADGTVGPKDLVRRFALRLSAESIPIGVLVPPAPPLAKPRRKLPAWFTKMDTNGDGDVSLREFLGPLELFRTLDRDGDGLISPEETVAERIP